jgi:hypothetical protein
MPNLTTTSARSGGLLVRRFGRVGKGVLLRRAHQQNQQPVMSERFGGLAEFIIGAHSRDPLAQPTLRF